MKSYEIYKLHNYFVTALKQPITIREAFLRLFGALCRDESYEVTKVTPFPYFSINRLAVKIEVYKMRNFVTFVTQNREY